MFFYKFIVSLLCSLFLASTATASRDNWIRCFFGKFPLVGLSSNDFSNIRIKNCLINKFEENHFGKPAFLNLTLESSKPLVEIGLFDMLAMKGSDYGYPQYDVVVISTSYETSSNQGHMPVSGGSMPMTEGHEMPIKLNSGNGYEELGFIGIERDDFLSKKQPYTLGDDEAVKKLKSFDFSSFRYQDKEVQAQHFHITGFKCN